MKLFENKMNNIMINEVLSISFHIMSNVKTAEANMLIVDRLLKNEVCLQLI